MKKIKLLMFYIIINLIFNYSCEKYHRMSAYMTTERLMTEEEEFQQLLDNEEETAIDEITKVEYVEPLKVWEDLHMNTDAARLSWVPLTCDSLRAKWSNYAHCQDLARMSNDEIETHMGKCCGNLSGPRYPEDFDSSDWRLLRYGCEDDDDEYEVPPWWDKYVCHGNCHAMAEFSLYVMSRVEPHVDWQIISGEHHSTCWDGDTRIFDMNYMAIVPELSAKETLIIAMGG